MATSDTPEQPSDAAAATAGTTAAAEPAAEHRPIDSFGQIGVPQGLRNSAGIVWRLLALLVGLYVVVQIIGYLGGVAVALFFSMVISALGIPIQRWLNKKMPSAVATVLTLIFMVVVVLLVMAFIVESIITEWSSLVQAAESGLTQIEDWLKTGPLHMDDSAVNGLIDQAQNWLGSQAPSFAKEIPSVLGSFGDFITAASVAVFGSFFFLNSGKQIWEFAMSWVPERVRTEVDDCGQAAWVTLSGYTRGIILVAIADGILVGIGLVILGVPLAPALAVVVMFGALIPVIGAPIATLFAAVVALASEGPWVALAVVGLTIVVGSFDGDIMQPLIMGHAVSLHPLAIVSLIAFGTLSFGIMGALLAVPIGGTVYSIAKYLTGRMPPPRLTPNTPKKPRLPKFLRRKKNAEAADVAVA